MDPGRPCARSGWVSLPLGLNCGSPFASPCLKMTVSLGVHDQYWIHRMYNNFFIVVVRPFNFFLIYWNCVSTLKYLSHIYFFLIYWICVWTLKYLSHIYFFLIFEVVYQHWNIHHIFIFSYIEVVCQHWNIYHIFIFS